MNYIMLGVIVSTLIIFAGIIFPGIYRCVNMIRAYVNDFNLDHYDYELPQFMDDVFDFITLGADDESMMCYVIVIFLFSLINILIFPLTLLVVLTYLIVRYIRYLKRKEKL